MTKEIWNFYMSFLKKKYSLVFELNSSIFPVVVNVVRIAHI